MSVYRRASVSILRFSSSLRIFFFFFVLTPFLAKAKVIASDWPYLRVYEKLVSCGEISVPFYGQRLWTEKEISRQLRSIDPDNPRGTCPPDTLRSFLEKMRPLSDKNVEKEISNVTWLKQAGFEYELLSGDSSPYPANDVGFIDADIRTFNENEGGRFLGEGHGFALSSQHEFYFKPLRVLGFVEPRADLLVSESFQSISDQRLTFQQAYAFFAPWKLQINVGRSPLVWGQGEYGGFLFTENARPLDHIEITHVPFRLPSFLKYIGKLKLTYVFGTLGPEQTYPWTLFTGLSIGVKPIEQFEFIVSHVVQFGGQGAPSITPSAGIRDFFGFIPFISQSAQSGSNKLTSLNTRVFFNSLYGFQGYLEYFMDDANLSGQGAAMRKHFFHNSSYQTGFYLTRFLNSPDDALRVEFTSTAPITYRHGIFQSGWTANRDIIGNALGPDGLRLQANWSHDWTETLTTDLRASWASRKADRYAVAANGLDVSVTQDNPAESRYSLFLKGSYVFKNPSFAADLGFGYEYVLNYHFSANNPQSLGAISVKVRKEFE